MSKHSPRAALTVTTTAIAIALTPAGCGRSGPNPSNRATTTNDNSPPRQGEAAMSWLDTVGWIGSILLVLSPLQTSVTRLRRPNHAATIMLTGYNTIIGVPITAMNLALVAINSFV